MEGSSRIGGDHPKPVYKGKKAPPAGNPFVDIMKVVIQYMNTQLGKKGWPPAYSTEECLNDTIQLQEGETNSNRVGLKHPKDIEESARNGMRWAQDMVAQGPEFLALQQRPKEAGTVTLVYKLRENRGKIKADIENLIPPIGYTIYYAIANNEENGEIIVRIELVPIKKLAVLKAEK